MSSRLTKVLYGVLALVIALWIYGQWSGSERQIKRQLGRFADTVEKEGQENGLVAANTSRKLGEFLTANFEIHAQPFAGVMTDRARLSQVMFQYRARAESIGVDFRDVELTVDEKLRIGDMDMVAMIAGKTDGGRFKESYRFKLRWVKEDGEWRIQRAELVEILEGPANLF